MTGSNASVFVAVLPALALTAAVVDWIGVGTNRRWVEYIGKPLTMVLLIAWLLTVAGPQVAFSLPAILILAALCFSLLGDIALMLPSDRFLLGLVSFLAAHVAYVVAFTWDRGPSRPAEWLVGGGVVALLAVLLPPIRKGLRRSGHDAYLMPVVLYAVVLASMLWAATIVPLHASWLMPGGAAIALGGAAFFASDVTLVWNRFIAPLPGRRVTTHVLYHLAQLALIGGVLSALRS